MFTVSLCIIYLGFVSPGLPESFFGVLGALFMKRLNKTVSKANK